MKNTNGSVTKRATFLVWTHRRSDRRAQLEQRRSVCLGRPSGGCKEEEQNRSDERRSGLESVLAPERLPPSLRYHIKKRNRTGHIEVGKAIYPRASTSFTPYPVFSPEGERTKVGEKGNEGKKNEKRHNEDPKSDEEEYADLPTRGRTSMAGCQ